MLSRAWDRAPFIGTGEAGDSGSLDNPSPGGAGVAFNAARALVDYRLVVVGSMLPDLVDKPVGIFLLGDVLHNGRIFTHSLLVFLAFALVAVYLWRRYGKNWGIVLSVSWALHLVFDGMWHMSETLFWPLLGWGFPQRVGSGWITSLFQAFLTDPETIIEESLGGAILAVLALRLLIARRVRVFIRTGAIDW